MDLGSIHAPQRFGRYILLDRMGAGGMAEVFRAVMPGAEGFRRDLVIKRILVDQARSPNFIEMFGHEARISALLHHPNIVQVFDFGLVEGSYFLAMELLRGCDLLRLMRSLRERERHLPIPIAAHIAHQVARGLGHAHGLKSPDGQPLNIVHRDISPSNIMCLRAGGVKLLDFGIASALGEVDSVPDATRTFKGKLPYMAPERLHNEPCDGRIDLFALGTVLWEMLTGKRLFGGRTDADRVRAILERPIPPPSSLRPEVPARLDAIVLKALERDPERRYAPGHSLADELEEVVLESKFHSRALPALLNELFGTAPSASHLALMSLPPDLFDADPTPAAAGPAATAVDADEAGTGIALVVGDASANPAEISFEDTVVTPAPPWTPRRRKMIAAGIAGTLAGLALAITVMRPRAMQGPASSQMPAAVVGAAFPAAPRRAAGPEIVPTTNPVAAPGLTVVPTANPVAGSVQCPQQEPVTTVSAPRSGATAQRAAGTVAPVAASGAVPTAPHAARIRAGVASGTQPGPAPRKIRVRRVTSHVSSDRIAKGLSIDPFAEAATRAVRP